MPRHQVAHSLFRSTLISALLFALLASGHAAARKVTLNGLEIGIDENNGGIVSLRYPQVGEILATEPEAAGFLDIAFPLAG